MPRIDLPTTAAMGFMFQWWLAIKNLHARIWPEQPTYSLRGTRQVDSYLFVWAAHNFRTAVKLVQRTVDDAAAGQIEVALLRFDEAVPDVKNLRNALAHFEEYALGEGNMQKALTSPQFGVYTSAGEDYCLYVSLAPGQAVLKIEIDKTATAAAALFKAVDHAIDP